MALKNALITELILKNLVLIVAFFGPRNIFHKLTDLQPNATDNALTSQDFFFLIRSLQRIQVQQLLLHCTKSREARSCMGSG